MFHEISTYIYLAAAAMICIPLHECSHGWVAYKLGDPTAKQLGRLTLNPVRHFDPVGFIMMVLVGFGWAKPVPVDMRYFRKPKRDMAIVGLAGPVSNLLLSLVCLIVTSAMEAFVRYSDVAQAVYSFFYFTALLSAGLGVFNLIPISPLDGSKIVGALLPERAYYTMLRYERYGTIILLVLVLAGNFLPQFDILGTVLSGARGAVMSLLSYLAHMPFRLLGLI